MTTKMTRRTFLKGAAAAAAAVSLSGLLTGCGGDQELPDNAVQLGVQRKHLRPERGPGG